MKKEFINKWHSYFSNSSDKIYKEFTKDLDQFENHIKEEFTKEALEYLWNNIEDFGKKAKYAAGEKGWIYNCVNLAVATNAINIMRDKAIRKCK